MRARHLAGVRAQGEGRQVHRARGDLCRQAGALVPRAGAHQGVPDGEEDSNQLILFFNNNFLDQYIHMRGPEELPLLHPDQAGLQADHVQRVQGGACQAVQGQEGACPHSGTAAS